MTPDFDCFIDPHDAEIEELRAEDARERLRIKAYFRNPDPRDPDYPGLPRSLENAQKES